MPGIHFLDARAPEGLRLYAIGDVHGRLDLLTAMHRAIAGEIERDRPADWRIIHLGDYIDRGPNSRGVVDFLIAAGERDARHLFLAGNHDAGLLDFLKSPDPNGLFMRFGGIETAQSYGVDLTAGPIDGMAAALATAIPVRHAEFLRRLALSARFGDFFFCHAGIRPGVPLGRQKRRDLIWIRDEFLNHPGLHPKVVVHGHTPQPEPQILPNRVNVDIRAFASGRLAAIAIDDADKRIMEVHEDGSVQRSATVTP